MGFTYQKVLGYKSRKQKMSLYEKYHMEDYRTGWVVLHLKNGDIFYGKLALTDVDYESKRFIFSIKFVKKLNQNYKIVKEYDKNTEFVFNIQDIILIEYLKEKI